MSSKYNISEVYDYEILKIIELVNKKKYSMVLLQFPDGLKNNAGRIVDFLREETKAEYFIYFGTCYGACDLPMHLSSLGFDLCIQFGHSEFVKNSEIIW